MKPNSQTPLPICLPPQIAMLTLLFLSSSFINVKADAPIALPDCQDTCGNGVRIPFPFGIGANCSLDSRYDIECKAIPPSKTITTPFLSKFNVEVLDIVVDVNDDTRNPVQTMTVNIPPPLKVCSADAQRQRRSSTIDLRGSPYNFSMDDNVLVMEGCAGSTVLVDQSEEIIVGCSTVCHNNNNTAIPRNKCFGVECCQMQLPSTTWLESGSYSPLQFYHIDFYGQALAEHSKYCMMVNLIKNDSVNQYLRKVSSTNSDSSTVPVELLWSWVNSRSPNYNPHRARCISDETLNKTACACNINGNFHGNPYIYNGCRVPEECRRCIGDCIRGQARDKFSCDSNLLFNVLIPLGYITFALGPLLLLFCCCCQYRCNKRRSKTEQRVKIFKQKLQQHQSTSEGVVERTKLFTHKQLDKATNHFNENRILGKGGQGIVYKGMLNDGRTVAVKKLKKMDESEMERLINEVVILSQIDHRNVVKLLGCCLEIEVPLLVYEFISNGTLSQLIHDPDEDFVLSWSMRLKIGAGAAGAIAYLHTYSSIPIYHRDIKSSNILLDDKYRAKVSDFGSSKTTSIDQTHLTTLVRGTMGYMDPEYFQSNQFTDKSDVYSFGVVLLELLTGKKPIYRDETMEQKSLVSEFLYMIQKCRLIDILDPQVVNEAKPEELVAVVDLANRCLNGSGKLRPAMNEVEMKLEMIIKSPAEMPLQQGQQVFPDEDFDEIVMAEIGDVELMSSPFPAAGIGSSLYIDVQPLLRETI